MTPGGQAGSDVVGTAVCYTLPRLISNSLSYIFGTYLGELYINTFKWRPEEFGKLTSIYTSALGVSHLVIGIAVNLITGKGGSNPGQTTQNGGQLNTTKGIEIFAVFIHALSYFFLIYLPIRWYGIQIMFFDMILIKAIRFIDMIFRISTLGSIGRLRKSKFETDVKMASIEPEPPPPRCVLCFNVPIFGAFLRLITSKRFVIYLCAVVHAIGLTSFDLCNRAIPTDVSKDDNKLKKINLINLGGYCITMLLITLIVSIIQFFFHNVITNAELLYMLAIFFIFFQAVIMPIFFIKTKPVGNSEENGKNNQEGSSGSSKNDKVFPDCLKLISVTVFHASVSFWLSTPGPLIQYLTSCVIAGNDSLKNFGPLMLLIGAIISMSIYTYATSSNSTEEQRGQSSNTKQTDTAITIGCICCQAIVYLLFFPFDYRWNKGNWFHFLLLILCGAVHGLFLLNLNNILDSVVKKDNFKGYKWSILGGFFSLTHLSVSISLYILYKAYDNEKSLDYDYFDIIRILDYTFAKVYIIISLFFQGANFIAAFACFSIS